MTDTELNEAVGRKLGWTGIGWNGFEKICGNPPHDPKDIKAAMVIATLPDYCNRIEAAFEIVASIEPDYWFAIRRKPVDDKFEWSCIIGKEADSKQPYQAEADTAPRAICEAFLKLP